MRLFLIVSVFFSMLFPAGQTAAVQVERLTDWNGGYFEVYGYPDSLRSEAIESGFFSNRGLYDVEYQPTVDVLQESDPVTFTIGQVSARKWVWTPGLICAISNGGSMSFFLLTYQCNTNSGPVYSVKVEVTSPGDTISASGYTGSGIVTTNAENTEITVSAPEGQSLSEWDSLNQQYTPISDLPVYTFSDHTFRFQIVVNGSGSTSAWREQLYTSFYIFNPLIQPDLGIADTFSVGTTADTIMDGYILQLSSLIIDPLQQYETIPFFFSISELEQAGVDWESLRLYRHLADVDEWVLAGKEGNINPVSGVFVQGPPTQTLGDYGVYRIDEEGLILVWANIDAPADYTVGGRMKKNMPLPAINYLLLSD